MQQNQQKFSNSRCEIIIFVDDGLYNLDNSSAKNVNSVIKRLGD